MSDNDSNRIQEESYEENVGMYVCFRNLLCSSILGILKYIAVIFPRFIFTWTIHLFPKTIRLIGRILIILILLGILLSLLCWPYIYWFSYHPNESKELCTIIEICWLLLIGIPGVYLGIKSSKKWFERWKAWWQKRRQSKLEIQKTIASDSNEN